MHTLLWECIQILHSQPHACLFLGGEGWKGAKSKHKNSSLINPHEMPKHKRKYLHRHNVTLKKSVWKSHITNTSKCTQYGPTIHSVCTQTNTLPTPANTPATPFQHTNKTLSLLSLESVIWGSWWGGGGAWPTIWRGHTNKHTGKILRHANTLPHSPTHWQM